MNSKSYIAIAGIGLMVAGLVEVLGLAAWWFSTGNWVVLSFVEAIGLIDPDSAALATLFLSDSDFLYFVFADSPLYGWLLGVGAALFVIGKRIQSYTPVPVEK